MTNISWVDGALKGKKAVDEINEEMKRKYGVRE